MQYFSSNGLQFACYGRINILPNQHGFKTTVIWMLEEEKNERNLRRSTIYFVIHSSDELHQMTHYLSINLNYSEQFILQKMS